MYILLAVWMAFLLPYQFSRYPISRMSSVFPFIWHLGCAIAYFDINFTDMSHFILLEMILVPTELRGKSPTIS